MTGIYLIGAITLFVLAIAVASAAAFVAIYSLFSALDRRFHVYCDETCDCHGVDTTTS